MPDPVEWNDLKKSGLRDDLIGPRNLKHPTNASFEPKEWVKKFRSESPATEADKNLYRAAIFYGQHLKDVRASYREVLWDIQLSEGLQLVLATVNQQYITARGKLNEHLKSHSKSSSVAYVGHLHQKLFATEHGQNFNLDDIITHLVDAIPSWIYQAKLNDGDRSLKSVEVNKVASAGLQLSSLESGFRSLWQYALWMDDYLDIEPEKITAENASDELAQHLFCCAMRQENNYMMPVHFELANTKMSGERRPKYPLEIPKSVVATYYDNRGRRKFRTGKMSVTSKANASFRFDRLVLENCYLSHFLNVPLPRLAQEVSVSDLMEVWWLLCGVAEQLVREIGDKSLDSEKGVRALSAKVPITQLKGLVVDCLGWTDAKADQAIGFLTLDLTKDSEIFRDGVWVKPLIPLGSCVVALVLSSLLLGSPVRRAEFWMKFGGLMKDGSKSSKGHIYEKALRKEISQKLAANPLLQSDYEIALDGVDDDEQIDLLVRVGGTVLVGEIKCLVAPSGPLEKRNFLDAMAEAVAQASRKAKWCTSESSRISQVTKKIPKNAKLKVQPLVIVNHGFGLGMSRDGVPIADAHFMKLLLGSGSYQGDMAFSRDHGVISESQTLYDDLADFEKNLKTILFSAPTLNIYRNSVVWRLEPFPVISNRPLMLKLPTQGKPPANPQVLRAVEELFLNR